MAQELARQSPFRSRYLLPVVLVPAVLATCAGGVVVLRAYNMCDVGVNATANLFGLIVIAPVLLLAHVVVLAVGQALVGWWVTSVRARVAAAVVITVTAVPAVSWAFFTLSGLPLQNALCPAGEPPWWPDWLPPSPEVYP